MQKAGYMIVCTLVGLPPEKGLALSLVKRLRHLLVGLPALLIWQGAEGRRLINRRAYREPAADG